MRSVLLLLAAPLLLAQRRGSTNHSREKHEHPGWVLSQHSFESTLTYDDNLEHWLCSGATMPLRDRVQIMPPVPDRHAIFWHRKPLSTEDFEASFTLDLSKRSPGEPAKGRNDGYFAVWIQPEDFSKKFDEGPMLKLKDWTKGIQDQGFTFAGNRPVVKGLGLVFTSRSQAEVGGSGPSVSVVYGDGNGADMKMYSDLPLAKGTSKSDRVQTEYFDWHVSKVDVKVRWGPAGITGSVNAGSTPFEFSLPDNVFLRTANDWPELYFGFTGYTGSSTFQEVNVRRFEMRNFDAKHTGEAGVLDKVDDDAWIEVLHKETRMMDQRSQKEAVEKLTQLLGQYVERYNTLGDKVKGDLVGLEGRLQSLEANCKTEISAISALNMDTGEFDVNVVKEHLTGIRDIIHKDKDKHNDKLDKMELMKDEIKTKSSDGLGAEGRKKVEEVAKISRALEEKVTSGSSQTSLLLFLMVAVVAGLAGLFLKRMRYYEKKHYI